VPTSRDARHFGRKRSQLVDHRIDGVLQLEHFAFDVDRDLARQVAAGDCGSDFGDVPHLCGQVRPHDDDRVGEILPRAGDAWDDGLHAETAFGADLARDARDFGGEGSQLFDHRVDRFFELQNLAAHIFRGG
jgi:CubicO group peptidase (beta-lactamase class C family)